MRLSCVTGNTRGSRAHHTMKVQADESLRVSSSSPVTEPVSGLRRDRMILVLTERKVRTRETREAECAARVTDEVNELHQAACQSERSYWELKQQTWRQDAPERTNTAATHKQVILKISKLPQTVGTHLSSSLTLSTRAGLCSESHVLYTHWAAFPHIPQTQ